eukprot:GHVS01058376.1.p1 GENE.GHVS01058376.1~~GHVS01058376.1.p1  ORF type:complete len:199 (+),score=22.90 GHVS01058376.1:27-599(+)
MSPPHRSPLLFLLLSLLVILASCCLSVSAGGSDKDDKPELPIDAKGLLSLFENEKEMMNCHVFYRYNEHNLGYADAIFRSSNYKPCMFLGDTTEWDILRSISFSELKADAEIVRVKKDGKKYAGLFTRFLPIPGKSPGVGLTKKQKDFFKHFDRNLDVLSRTIGRGDAKLCDEIENHNVVTFKRELAFFF